MASASASGSDTEAELSEEGGSESGFTVLLNNNNLLSGAQAEAKATETEMAHVYSQQVHSMVESYEWFIKQMRDLTVGQGAEVMTRREGDSSGLNGTPGKVPPPPVDKERVRKIISYRDSTVSGTRQGSSPPSSSIMEGAGDNISGCHPFQASTIPTQPVNVKPCCSHANNNDQLQKKIDTICGFVQMLFTNQVQLLGKSFQDQMELRQRVDELKSLTENTDEDLEYLEKEMLILKKGLFSIKVITKKTVDDRVKTVLDDLSQHVEGVNERIGRLCQEVAGMSSAIRASNKENNTEDAPGSSSRDEKGQGHCGATLDPQPFDVNEEEIILD